MSAIPATASPLPPPRRRPPTPRPALPPTVCSRPPSAPSSARSPRTAPPSSPRSVRPAANRMTTQRLLGVETEYALATADTRGVALERLPLLDGLMRSARRRLVHLPDELGRGMFLESGGRFYPDCGGHPEMTTPECADPWQL